MKNLKRILTSFVILGLGLTFASCEGSCERSGEKIDRQVEKAGDKIEDATDRK